MKIIVCAETPKNANFRIKFSLSRPFPSMPSLHVNAISKLHGAGPVCLRRRWHAVYQLINFPLSLNSRHQNLLNRSISSFSSSPRTQMPEQEHEKTYSNEESSTFPFWQPFSINNFMFVESIKRWKHCNKFMISINSWLKVIKKSFPTSEDRKALSWRLWINSN
jgi:hypothetical protein